MKLKLSGLGLKGLTRKRKILLIVSSVLFLVFSVSGVYLLWRVSQPESIAPEDIDASQYDCSFCSASYKHAKASFNIPDFLPEGGSPEYIACLNEESDTLPDPGDGYTLPVIPIDPPAIMGVEDSGRTRECVCAVQHYYEETKAATPGGDIIYTCDDTCKLGLGISWSGYFTCGEPDEHDVYVYEMIEEIREVDPTQEHYHCGRCSSVYRHAYASWRVPKEYEKACELALSEGFVDAEDVFYTCSEECNCDYIPPSGNQYEYTCVDEIQQEPTGGEGIRHWDNSTCWFGKYSFNVPSPCPSEDLIRTDTTYVDCFNSLLRCGENEDDYNRKDTGWINPLNEYFCPVNHKDIPFSPPSFPPPGQTASWNCMGYHHVQHCTATRGVYLTYRVDNAGGGTLSGDGKHNQSEIVLDVKLGNSGSLIQALPGQGKQFNRWDDNSTIATRSDSATSSGDRVFIASFEDVEPIEIPVECECPSCPEGYTMTPCSGEYCSIQVLPCTPLNSDCGSVTCYKLTPPPDPLCGTNAGLVFQATDVDWPTGGSFCSEGESNPMQPTFPGAGSTSHWSCESGSEVANCSASRLDPDPVCGTNAGLVFEATDVDWPTDGSFCSEGAPDPMNPIFPDAGSTIHWNCESGSEVATCLASRLDPDPVCGTNAGLVFEATDVDWPTDGSFCSEGDSDPTNPSFPPVGSDTSWTCMSGLESILCLASRLEAQEVIVEEEGPAEVIIIQRPDGTLVQVEKIPETGIFDNVERPVLIGGILLFLGLTWSWIGRGIFVTLKFFSKIRRKLLIGMGEIREGIQLRRRTNRMRKNTKRRQKFEKRVVKD